MDNTEQMACKMWLVALMAEHAGEGETFGIYVNTPAPDIDYLDYEYVYALNTHLSEPLVERLMELCIQYNGFWLAWPCLTEAELGEVMKAGAARFLYSEATPDE